MNDLEKQFVVIRVYKPGDELECSKVLKEGVMSTVRRAFFTVLTREVTVKLIVATTAFMFVFAGFLPIVCISSVPATIIFIYIFVYALHLKKASDMNDEAMNISKMFMSSKYTCFWVAEVYEPYYLKKSPSQLNYPILQESELDVRLEDSGIYYKKIIGTVGIDRCDKMHGSAWLRRMAVSSKYQRKGIGTALLKEAIGFCRNKGYEIVGLTISEYNDEARKLYLQNNFTLLQMYHKPTLGAVVHTLMYEFTYSIPENCRHDISLILMY